MLILKNVLKIHFISGRLFPRFKKSKHSSHDRNKMTQ